MKFVVHWVWATLEEVCHWARQLSIRGSKRWRPCANRIPRYSYCVTLQSVTPFRDRTVSPEEYRGVGMDSTGPQSFTENSNEQGPPPVQPWTLLHYTQRTTPYTKDFDSMCGSHFLTSWSLIFRIKLTPQCMLYRLEHPLGKVSDEKPGLVVSIADWVESHVSLAKSWFFFFF